MTSGRLHIIWVAWMRGVLSHSSHLGPSQDAEARPRKAPARMKVSSVFKVAIVREPRSGDVGASFSTRHPACYLESRAASSARRPVRGHHLRVCPLPARPRVPPQPGHGDDGAAGALLPARVRVQSVRASAQEPHPRGLLRKHRARRRVPRAGRPYAGTGDDAPAFLRLLSPVTTWSPPPSRPPSALPAVPRINGRRSPPARVAAPSCVVNARSSSGRPPPARIASPCSSGGALPPGLSR